MKKSFCFEVVEIGLISVRVLEPDFLSRRIWRLSLMICPWVGRVGGRRASPYRSPRRGHPPIGLRHGRPLRESSLLTAAKSTVAHGEAGETLRDAEQDILPQ